MYGSQRYMRFSPSIIAPLLSLPTGVAPSLDALTECVVDHTWDHHVQPFQLPPGVEVLMADVSCGANTPSMVKKVLAWRKEGGASALWERYATASNALQAALNDLCVMHRDVKSMGTDDEGWLAELARCGAAGASNGRRWAKWASHSARCVAGASRCVPCCGPSASKRRRPSSRQSRRRSSTRRSPCAAF